MRADPLSGDVAKLTGQNAFRRRVGNYRIICDIEFRTQTVRVFAILRRTSTTYRWFDLSLEAASVRELNGAHLFRFDLDHCMCQGY